MLALQRAARRIHISAGAEAVVFDAPRLSSVSLRQPISVKVEFADGLAFNLTAEFLRVYSPAASSKIRSIGGEKVVLGRRHGRFMSAEPIGNYGVRLLVDDLHLIGMYTWNYFYHLGSNKLYSRVSMQACSLA